jgi:hypothetical protein
MLDGSRADHKQMEHSFKSEVYPFLWKAYPLLKVPHTVALG